MVDMFTAVDDSPMSSSLRVLVPALCALVLLSLAWFCVNLARRGKEHPPGPKPWPIIGNASQIPMRYPWKMYSKWAKEFQTEVLYLNVLGRPIVILDTATAAQDLLDKRASFYSDRPRFSFFELMGWSWAVQFLGYSGNFQKHRRPLHTYLSAPDLPTYWPGQFNETRALLKDLTQDPNGFMKHIKHAAAGMTTTMLYGIPRGPARSTIIHIAEQATESLMAAGNFGDHLVDFLPLMKHIPEWFPGAGFHKQAREWNKLSEGMINAPFEDVKHRMAAGDLMPCLVSKLLKVQASGQDPTMTDDMIKTTAGVIYLGGADTTTSAVYTLLLAITLYPQIQILAQAEIDAVCQRQRLPNPQDRQSMPYVENIIKELFRWNPSTPLGVPHRVSQDDLYEGYVIPNGSVVIANIWSICHDPAMYPDPFRFNPDRYQSRDGKLNPNVLDPRALAFGFGRRICPGRFIGDSAVWTMVSSILAVLTIKKASNSEGVELTPSVEYTTGLVSRPLPFPCSITPRCELSKAFIMSFEE